MKHVKTLGNRMKFWKDIKGFTLIEIAIVLIIIGIIIGAVVKGKDIIRSAEQKSLYNKWIMAWQTSYMTYNDRTGKILDDSNNATNAGPYNGLANGDGINAVLANPPTNNVELQLVGAGIECPPAGPENLTAHRRYTDSIGNNVDHVLILYGIASIGNCIRIQNILPELGMAIDKIVDGVSDGTQGDVRYSEVGAPTAAQFLAWPAANVTPLPAARYMWIRLGK